jgi:dihydrofolate synthase/folylpolyglutamate synthase
LQLGFELIQLNKLLEKFIFLADKKKYLGGVGLKRVNYLYNSVFDTPFTIPAIHVVGTSGKGTLCTSISEIIIKNGMKVGTIKSPHILDIRERFTINNHFPSTKQVIKSFSKVIDSSEKMYFNSEFGMPTYFEIIFIASLDIFLNNDVDIVVIEAGVGGELDTSNILEKKLVNILTSIGLDHQNVLGETLNQILSNKLGIARNNIPFICNNLSKKQQTFCKKWIKNKNLNYKYYFTNEFEDIISRTCKLLKIKKYKRNIKNLDEILPARLQHISINNKKVIVDIAHNLQKIEYSINKNINKTKIGLVVSFVEEKDIEDIIDFFSKLSPSISHYVTTSTIYFREIYSPKELSCLYSKYNIKHKSYISPYNAIQEALNENKTIIIIGSTYLASDALEFFKTYEK